MEARQTCVSPGCSSNVSEVWSRGGAWSLGAILGRLWLPCGQDQEQASASLLEIVLIGRPKGVPKSGCAVAALLLQLSEPGSAAAPAGAEQSGHRARALFWRGRWHLPSVCPRGQRARVHGRSPCGYLPAGLFLQTGSGQGGWWTWCTRR